MSDIPHSVFEQLVTIINPFMGNQEDRKAIVRLGVYDRNFIHQLDFSGKPISFTTNFLYQLIEYDAHLLLKLIETLIKHYAGSDKQILKQLHKAIRQILEPKNTPPDGGMKILLIDKDKLDQYSQDDLNRLIQKRFPDNNEYYILDFQYSDFIMAIVITANKLSEPQHLEHLIYYLRIPDNLENLFESTRIHSNYLSQTLLLDQMTHLSRPSHEYNQVEIMRHSNDLKRKNLFSISEENTIRSFGDFRNISSMHDRGSTHIH